MLRINHLTLAAVVFLLLSGPATADADPANTPDLTGTWILNDDASDDLGANQGAGRGGGQKRGGGGRGGGRGGGGRQHPPADGDQRQGRLPRHLARLEIFHAGDEFTLTDGTEVSRFVTTDGRPCRVWTDQGQITADAHWEGRALAVAWHGPEDSERTTRFSLSEDGNQLNVLEQLRKPGTDENITLKLVYDISEPNRN